MNPLNYPIEKIVSLETLSRIQEENRGYIVIAESASPSVVHRPDCSFVNARDFSYRVKKGHGQSSNFFWVLDSELGRKVFKAQDCLVCLRPGRESE